MSLETRGGGLWSPAVFLRSGREPVSEQATSQAVHAEDYRVCRLKPNAETFGAVIDFLARVKPFSEFRAGALTSAVRDQLLLQHHICAMRGPTLIGYCGWLLTSQEIGERWLHEQGSLDPVADDRADAGALTIVRAEDPKVLRKLIVPSGHHQTGRLTATSVPHCRGEHRSARQLRRISCAQAQKASAIGFNSAWRRRWAASTPYGAPI